VPLALTYQADTTIPVEIEGVTPQAVKTQSLSDIEKIEIFHGNEKLPLGAMFDVAGDAGDGRIDFHGDLSGVHWIGAHMTEGVVHVHGNAGRHVGSEMRGGLIHVDGDASDWVGGEMRGGLIHVRGRAGHLVGAAYRGSRHGMTGGTILIHGDAGNEIGHTMRRGWIAIGGRSGDLAGFNMLAGSVFLFGETGIRHGAGMRRGTIGLFAGDVPELLPTFRHACRYRPPALALMFPHLDQHGFPLEGALLSAEYDLYNGDFVEQGRGEILVRTS
jgi:formylmethanofuran dehydrogenase subunit C